MVCTRLNGTSKIICSNPELSGYDELVADNTADNNLRYIGADPNNYVSFNGELWRIIGIMNNMEKADDTIESLVKIIRDESIENIAWDSARTNNWNTASLQTTLNGDYLNGSYTSTGITSDIARNMIETVTWKLGGSSTYNDVTASMFYERERGTDVYSGRPTEWDGKIGLMYPSDYGYATSGGTTTDRAMCLATALNNWGTLSDCHNNNWLYDSSGGFKWTLTSVSSSSTRAYSVSQTAVSATTSITNRNASPSVYLKSNIVVSGGTGTATDPYTLTMN